MIWRPLPDDYEEATVDAETGEVKPVGKPPKRQYKEVYDVFEEVLGKRPLNWTVNVTQQKAAENLVKERGLKAIRNALRFYLDHKDEEFCPQITSPADLDAKWSKLAGFKSKNYGG